MSIFLRLGGGFAQAGTLISLTSAFGANNNRGDESSSSLISEKSLTLPEPPSFEIESRAGFLACVGEEVATGEKGVVKLFDEEGW